MKGLSERLEDAIHGCRYLDAAIYEALGFRVKRHPEQTTNRYGGTRYGRSWAFLRDSRWEAMRHLTTSIDDAASLVPDGWTWFGTNLGEDGQPQACVTDADHVDHVGNAATPALALCSAAVRAGARGA
jgi:hypothetical protein